MTVLISDHRGRLADWLTIVSFVMAGLYTFSLVISGETASYRRYVALTALCIAASISPMYFDNTARWSILGFDVIKEVLTLSMICMLLCFSWLVTLRPKSSKIMIFILFFGAFAATAPIFGANETVGLAAMQLLAVLALMITYLIIDAPKRILSGN